MCQEGGRDASPRTVSLTSPAMRAKPHRVCHSYGNHCQVQCLQAGPQAEEDPVEALSRLAGRLLIFHFLRVATKVRDFHVQFPVR